MAKDILRGLWTRLRAIIRGESESTAIRDELAFHLDSLAADYERQGMSANAARRQARIDLGSPVSAAEQCRDTSGANWLEDLRKDTVLALRTLRKSPGFAVAALFTLALGIGLNTSLFTVLYSIAFRPLPVAHPETLWNAYMELQRGESEPRSSYESQYYESFAEFTYLRAHSKTAELAGAAESGLTPRGLSAKKLHAHLVSDNLLPMMGARPALGRFFLPEDTRTPGRNAVVVLSHATWREQFASDPNVVGRVVTLNRTPFTIIGVANREYVGPMLQIPDVWISVTMQALTRPGESLVDNPNAAFMQVFGRNRAGYSSEQVKAEMAILGNQALAAHHSKATAKMHIVPAALLNHPDVMGSLKPVLVVVWIIGGLVLLVACSNVANLLLARGLSRRREIAIRLAIGAGRGRLVRQMLTESLLLGFAGGTVGLFLAWQGGAIALRMIPGEVVRPQLDLRPDPTVLAFALGASLLAALASGLLPAFHALGVDLTPSLKSEGLLDSRKGRRAWLQNALVGVQVCVSVILLVNAGLMTRGFLRAASLETGRVHRGLLITSFDLRQQQYTPETAELFHTKLAAILATTPGIEASSVSLLEPELGSNGSSVRSVEPGDARGPEISVNFDEIGADYFRAAGISVISGRSFTPAEVAGNARLLVVDERLAKRVFGGDAIGRRVALGPDDSRETWEIVGVASPVTSLLPGSPSRPWYYAPLRGLRYMEARVWVRHRGTVREATDAVRTAVKALDPEVTVGANTADKDASTALLPVRIASWAAGSLGALALLIAAIGLYGVISFAVSRRLREMGVRIALGAKPFDVLRLVFGQLPGPMGIGSLVGIAAAVGLGFLLRAMLYGVSPVDPVVLFVVVGVLSLTAVIASLAPARRAIRVDPATVLRNE